MTLSLRRRPWPVLSALLLSACSSSPGATSNDASFVTDAPPGYVAVSPWTGRLVLPSLAERRPDGAVRIELRNAPDASLVGREVWVRFESGLAWPREVTRDVTFGDEARASEAKGNIHPARIDGWKQVSPLESLAGARPADDVEVALDDARLEGDELVIAHDPVQIAGDLVGLVQIDGPAAGGAPGERTVRHWNAAARDFSGTSETIVFDAPATRGLPDGEKFSPIDGIESSPLQAAGFYVHGRVGGDGRFHVAAIEPRQTRLLGPDGVKVGAAAAPFATDAVWDDTPGQKGAARSVLLAPVADEAGARPWADASFVEGTELLVTHLFGSIGPVEDGPLRTGHFAFGVGRVVREPLTGELQLDVRYRQIYAHNSQGIVAGTHTFAEYEGSFARGWMYTRPVSDVALFLPALVRDYDLGGVKFRPLDGLVREFEAMAARYRTGNGTGASIVTPANSCVQDSSQALFFALMKFNDQVRENPNAAQFLAARPSDPQVLDFQTLDRLATDVEGFLSPLGVKRIDWEKNLNNVAAVNGCPGGLAGQIVCALGSHQTIFPRNGNDLYVKALLGAGAGGVAITTYQAGGSAPGLVPLSPTSPTHLF
jgi:predicted Abi (CAAX) family protease